MLAYFGQFGQYRIVNLRTFWCNFAGLNNAMVYQNEKKYEVCLTMAVKRDGLVTKIGIGM